MRSTGPTLSLWQFFLAITVLYLIMRFVPGGIIIGAMILLATILSTPDAVSAFSDLLTWLENPTL